MSGEEIYKFMYGMCGFLTLFGHFAGYITYQEAVVPVLVLILFALLGMRWEE